MTNTDPRPEKDAVHGSEAPAVAAPDSLEELTAQVLEQEREAEEPRTARSVFWLQHGTRLRGSDHVYRNQYVLVRVGTAFGACAVEAGELGPEVSDLSGLPVAELLEHPAAPVRMAALDAALGARRPHRLDPRARRTELPTGTPDERAVARDRAVAGLLDFPSGSRVALIGVVNPLVQAIRERGGEPLPCDFALSRTQWGDPVSSDMHEVLDRADAVLATGMTVGNGSFDVIRRHCTEAGIPLVVYAQSGAAVVREFLGRGVTGISAEHFPFSQFSADASPLYLYHV